MPVKKYDCVHENVFIESNQHSIFLPAEGFKIIYLNLKCFGSFLQYATCDLSRAINKGFSLHIMSIRIIVSCLNQDKLC